MPVLFEGFPRILERRALKPGRWFMTASGHGPRLCLLSEVQIEGKALVLTFGLGKLDAIEFNTARLEDIDGPLTSVEDDLVFAPGEGAEKLRLLAPTRRPFLSGSLLRLSNGEMGIGFAESFRGDLMIVSLSSGLGVTGYELVFDRWTLSLRRGGVESLVGHFKGSPRADASAFARPARPG